MSTKRSKKSTLPQPSTRPFSRRLVPFRHPDFSDDQIQRLTEGTLISKDRLLRTLRKLDTTTTSAFLTVSGNKDSNCGPYGPPVSPGSVPSDGELLSAMMTRLVWLETKLSESHRQLQDKEKVINKHEEQIAILNQARVAYDGGPIHQLEDTCIRLQTEVHQMEQLLNDFGLVWTGAKRHSNSSTVTSNDGEIPEDCISLKSTCNSNLSSGPIEDGIKPKVDYDLMIENIHDLNMLAGEGVPQIFMSPDANFKVVDHVPIALYSNGISLCGGPFRPFSESATMQCVQDLMDGYFPSELQRRYPNGVPLKIIDKRHLEFQDKTLKTLPVPISRSPSLSPISPVSPTSPFSSGSPSRVSDSHSPQSSPLTVQNLLSALPRMVVRDGRLLDVRHSIVQLLKGSGYNIDITVIHTHVIQHLREGRPVENITTLRIYNETGSESYLVKLYATDCIGDIRKYLDLHRTSHSSDYDILFLYPRRVFDKPEETLEACGLVPNAALYLYQRTKNSNFTVSHH